MSTLRRRSAKAAKDEEDDAMEDEEDLSEHRSASDVAMKDDDDEDEAKQETKTDEDEDEDVGRSRQPSKRRRRAGSSRRGRGAAAAAAASQQQPSLRSDIRERNLAVATREASRLARPESAAGKRVFSGHASKSRSAVTSTPSGFVESPAAAKGGGQKEGEEEAEEWCGPFAVARQLIAKREEARQRLEAERKRRLEGADDEEGDGGDHPLDAAVHEASMEQKRQAMPSLGWKSPLTFSDEASEKDNLYVKRQKRQATRYAALRRVPSLFDTCLDFLVHNFDHVESLGLAVDSWIRRSLGAALVSRGKLDAAAFAVLAENGIESLELVDCAQVTQDVLASSLSQLVPAGLHTLVLHHAGRCFGPVAVQALLKNCGDNNNNNNKLERLEISGAYLLTDAHAAQLVTHLQAKSLAFTACPLLGQEFCTAISQSHESLEELSLQDLTLCQEALLSAAPGFQRLETLKLVQMEALDDSVLQTLLTSCSSSRLQRLELEYLVQVTDRVLPVIRSSCPNLQSLSLRGLRSLTSAGLEAFFATSVMVEGSAPPPSWTLRKLDLSECHVDAVTDAVLQGALASSGSGGGTSLTYLGVAKSQVTDRTMERLAQLEPSTKLQELDMGFCPHITNQGLGFLLQKAPEIKKVSIWGCAQLTDEVLDYAAFRHVEIVGAWMKQGEGRALR